MRGSMRRETLDLEHDMAGGLTCGLGAAVELL